MSGFCEPIEASDGVRIQKPATPPDSFTEEECREVVGRVLNPPKTLLPEPAPDGVPFERYVPTWAPLISDVHGPITMSYCDAQGKFQTMILSVERLAGMMYSAHRILGKRMGEIDGQEKARQAGAGPGSI
jgi:hypothetical protein